MSDRRGHNKGPRAAATPKVSKSIPALAKQGTFQPAPAHNLAVRWSHFDLRGPWCIGNSSIESIVDLVEHLQGLESQLADVVFSGEIGKHYEVHKIPTKAAAARLKELGLDTEDRISRLRVSGAGRLYGFRRFNEFYALWWDPQHKIWPSSK